LFDFKMALRAFRVSSLASASRRIVRRASSAAERTRSDFWRSLMTAIRAGMAMNFCHWSRSRAVVLVLASSNRLIR